MFLGFELANDQMMVKLYFLPSLKAALTGQTPLALSKEALQHLKGENGEPIFDLRMVCDYLESFPDATAPKPFIIAVDAEAPPKTRLKIYVRSPQTSFASVVDMLEMGGQLPALSSRALASLKELWQSVLDVDENFSSEKALPHRSHQTAGLLYYFSVKPGSKIPKVKVYLPVRHYGRSDYDIAAGLSAFLLKRGKCLNGATYLQGVRQLW
jgi:DMATS type aromatic prenyltransferase